MTFIMMALSLYAFMKPARMSSLLQENGCAYSEEHAELKDVFFHGDRYSLVTALTVDGYIDFMEPNGCQPSSSSKHPSYFPPTSSSTDKHTKE